MNGPPAHARVVIIGGGIVGCSTAYHLAAAGWRDVVLLERARLTSGSTWHAAGLVGQLRSHASVTRLLGHSVALYGRLEAETGQATGWKMHGSLRLACSAARMAEIQRQATIARSFGLELHLLTPREARDLWPLMDISGVVGAAFLPTDGQANPADITQALAKGARRHGARIVEECEVTGVESRHGRVSGVATARGTIRCEAVVNCAGQWARAFAQRSGVNIPLASVRHQYLVTAPIDGLARDLPALRDPDQLVYFKEEVGGLVAGGFERDPRPWAEEGIPEGFHFTLLDADWDQFEPLMEAALARVPAFETAGVKQLVNGPEGFTPDGNFILGEAPELDGYYVGAGFNAFGIAAGGGAGKALAEWIMGGEPPYDLWPVDIRRFGAPHRDIGWVRRRALDSYARHYTLAWPFEERASGRPLRRSPLYGVLEAAGACFGEKMGWERPNWFAPPGVKPRDIYTFGRQNWFPHVGEEHAAARERVAVFDQSSFAKFLLIGKDAERALSWLCANHVAKPPGALTYTPMLNRRGGIECDLTVARLADDRFYVVTGTGAATHDYHWISRHIDGGLDARLVDVTSAYAVISLFGPHARDVLAPLTEGDISNAAFPFASVREVTVAGAPVTALRITYVGELGWELHTPVEFAVGVHAALLEAGAPFGIRNAGYRAIESLRLEKGYRAWGADITPDHTPLEAGLRWAVKLGRATPFLGREALERAQAHPLRRRLVGFTVDDAGVVLLGQETVYRDGERVGWLTSGGYGYTVGKGIGYGYVQHAGGVGRELLETGRYELEVATDRVPCALHLEPLYDPELRRVKC